MKKLSIRQILQIQILAIFLLPTSGFAMSDEVAEKMMKRLSELEAEVKYLKSTQQEQKVKLEELPETMKTAEKKSDSLLSDWDWSIGGYAKLDVTTTNYSAGELAGNSNLRDAYVPGAIPVGGDREHNDTDFHVRESRINFKLKKDYEGHKLGAFLEMDFMITPNGNERVSNSYTPRLRHYKFQFDNWVFGQTWSTFQDVSAMAENLAFFGPVDSSVFIRQPLIRYTHQSDYGSFEFAIENPETTVTPFGGGARIETDDGEMPDIVARYKYKKDWGHVALAGIVRRLSYADNATNIDDDIVVGGGSLTGKIKIGERDDFRFVFNAGSGLGRYIGLNIVNGAVLDANGSLEAINSYGGNISYRHFWNDKWRSNATISGTVFDNDTNLTGLGVTEKIWSSHINLLYSPVKKVTFGLEWLHAQRAIESGDKGDMDRFQFSAKYAF
ncbi:MAG: DcaP family trimeric outer membrane transporter [Methylococcaceae bacterium]